MTRPRHVDDLQSFTVCSMQAIPPRKYGAAALSELSVCGQAYSQRGRQRNSVIAISAAINGSLNGPT